MKLEHLFQFAQLQHYNSLNKASEDLFISHQALSKIISSLENYFNTQLIVRTSNGIKFTQNGLLLAKKAEEIATLIEQTDKKMNAHYLKTDSRQIKIYTDFITNAYVISKFIPYFENQYPFIQFDVIVQNAISDYVVCSNSHHSDMQNTFGLFSFFDTMPPDLTHLINFSYILLDTKKLFIATKKDCKLKDINTFVLNKREFGTDSAILSYLNVPHIFYVNSQRQCYLALQDSLTGTIAFDSNHYANTLDDIVLTAFEKNLYLYTYIINANTNSDFIKTFSNLLYKFFQQKKFPQKEEYV